MHTIIFSLYIHDNYHHELTEANCCSVWMHIRVLLEFLVLPDLMAHQVPLVWMVMLGLQEKVALQE